MRLPDRLPARLPLALFAVLALATVAAFYITQHLKTKNPLINGAPRADPALINPRYGGVCSDAAGRRVSFRGTSLGFYLQSHSDRVFVYVVNDNNDNVATMSGSGRYVRAATNNYQFFHWNGRTYDGRPAPDGTYTFRVFLQHEDRTLPVAGTSVQVESSRPRPRLGTVSVTPLAGGGTVTTPAGATPYLTPTRQTATVKLAPAGHPLGTNVLVFSASPNPNTPLKLLKRFGTDPHRRTATWNGLIDGHPAPAGTYLLGLSVTDQACTTGQTPSIDDPAPHSTAGAGVNVTYLNASPPVDPVPAGQLASVGVNSGGAAFRWALRRAGSARVIFHGRDPGDGKMRVRMPGIGLYALTLVAGGHRTTVPLVASGVGARAAADVLVVLPALSWQGANPTDDDTDGLVDTLGPGGDQVSLERPLVAGLPAGFSDEAALVNFLNARGLSYDLTTDVALAEGIGPSLSGRHGVLLDGTFTWVPSQLVPRLRSFVSAGGGAFADSFRSLIGSAPVTDGTYGPIAGPARPLTADPFEVRHGTVSPSYGQLITALTDHLGILDGVAALQFPRYEVLQPPGGRVASAAGVAASAPSVIGFRLGAGTVVEAGLPNYGLSLSSDVDAGQMLSRVWQVVLR